MKKIIIISALVLGAGFMFAKDKATKLLSEYENVFKQLQIKLGGISNVNVSGSELKANVVLHITNPTPIHLGVDTNNYVTLKKLLFYTQSGNYIGEAHPNISNLQLPAQETTATPSIPVVVPINNNVFSIGIELMTNSKNLQVKAVLEAFNQTYTV